MTLVNCLKKLVQKAYHFNPLTIKNAIIFKEASINFWMILSSMELQISGKLDLPSFKQPVFSKKQNEEIEPITDVPF